MSGQFVGLACEAARRRCRLLNHCGILLRDAVHFGDAGVDLMQPNQLLLGRGADRGHQRADVADPRVDRLQRRAGLRDQLDAQTDLYGRGVDLCLDVLRRIGRALRQGANLLRHHGEPLACVTRPRGLDIGVERREIGLEGDRVDDLMMSLISLDERSMPPIASTTRRTTSRETAAPNEHGYTTSTHGLWHHAVDLIISGNWRDLLATAEFTTLRDLFHAVAFGLRYSGAHDTAGRGGYLSIADARTIMDELGATEPTSRTATVREFSTPMSCNPEGKKGGEHWPINGRPSSPEDTAWGFIFGIEDGWFEYDRSGHLSWSQKGRDRYAAGDRPTYVEATGQVAFAF